MNLGAMRLPLVILAWGWMASAGAALPDYRQQDFTLPAATRGLIAADVNDDGLQDLISVIENRVRVYFQRGDGFDFAGRFGEIALPGTAAGWDVGQVDDGVTAIIALVDGREVLAWPISGESIGAPRTLVSGLPGFLGNGVQRLYFVRDVDGDGRADLIIPGVGELYLYMAAAEGWQPGLSIPVEGRLRTVLSPDRLERRVGQAVRLPLMEMRDLNADGLDDLVSRTDERLDVFIANGTDLPRFPDEPSWSLDIGAIEARLGEFDVDKLDFSNLTGISALTHEEILQDVDGDGIDDLLLREGGKVSLFSGASDGMNLQQPRQVLRSGGNVLKVFLHDEDEDGRPDLWLWRVEPVSVGDLFVWLALSGSVDLEAFVYPNDGTRFARRPSRRLGVTVRFPSVIRLAARYREIVRETRQAGQRQPVPLTTANVDGDATALDLLLLIDRNLEIFLNRIEPEDGEQPFLGALGYSRQRDAYEIDIRELVDNFAVGDDPRLTSVSGQTADLAVDVGSPGTGGDIIALELNGDGADDVFVFTGRDAGLIRGMLLISRQAHSEAAADAIRRR